MNNMRNNLSMDDSRVEAFPPHPYMKVEAVAQEDSTETDIDIFYE
jgi:hypothetical protein